jgi:hypothetical protein
MNTLAKIKRTGWRYSFAIAFNRVVPAWLFRCRRYVIYELAANRRNDIKRNENVDVRWCQGESEIQAVEALTWFQRSSISGNAAACQATIDGELAGGFWSATQCFEETELGVRYLLDPGQAWLFAALVNREHRRLGVYNEILRFVLADLEAQGLNQLLVAVNPDNIGSLHVHRQHADRTLGTVIAIRCFAITICFVSGDIKRDRSVSFNSSKSPIELSFGQAK